MPGELYRSAPVAVTLAGNGRTLSGHAIRYGDRSRQFRELVEPRAFVERASPLVLNMQHDRQRPIADTSGTLTVADSDAGLHVATPLREGSAELDLVRRGSLAGLSVEMRVLRDRIEAGWRVIERAVLLAIGLVDRPAYPASSVELRRWNAAQRVARYTSRVPTGRRLRCECSDGANFAEFAADAFTKALTEQAASGANVTAVVNSYDNVIASTDRGTLRLGTDADGALTVDVDIPDTPLGHRLLDADNDAGTVARPFVDDPDGTRSELIMGDDGENVRRWTAPKLRAIVLTGTDAREGWPAPAVTLLDGDDAQRAAPDPTAGVLAWL